MTYLCSHWQDLWQDEDDTRQQGPAEGNSCNGLTPPAQVEGAPLEQFLIHQQAQRDGHCKDAKVKARYGKQQA
jgi:hypothetical protein